MTNEQIAEAFSRHAFATTYPHLADDIVWDNIGGPQLSGKADVMHACDQSATYLANVTTRFTRFRTVVGAHSVVVDSVAAYTDAEDETTTVASCDIYDFADGLLRRITSYTMELTCETGVILSDHADLATTLSPRGAMAAAAAGIASCAPTERSSS